MRGSGRSIQKLLIILNQGDIRRPGGLIRGGQLEQYRP